MTDHIVEAEELLNLGIDYSDPRNPPHAAGQQAQVHATIALIEATKAQTEQLRLGNIIAYTTAKGYGLSDQTLDEIGRGLGL